MLRDITIGQHFPGNSVLHRCDPAEEGTFAAVYCEELEMQYRG